MGWVNYHRTVAAAETFQKMDSIIWSMLWRWAKRRHPRKGYTWIAHRYWHSERTRMWTFKTDCHTLKLFADVHYRGHRQMNLSASLYLDRVYFHKRGEYAEQRPSTFPE